MTRRALGVLMLAVVGCGGDEAPVGPAASAAFPEPEILPAVEAPPDPFTMFADGSPVTTVGDWETRRRPELRDLFAHYVYGVSPEPAPVVVAEVVRATILAGQVDYRELEVSLGEGAPATLALFLPVDAAGPVPVLLALNKCGNHSVTEDPTVTASARWADAPCGTAPENRGVRASSFPVGTIVSRGYALATVHESDFDPDDPLGPRGDGIQGRFPVDVDGASSWGTVAAWAWGLSRMVDALETVDAVDATRIATVGHSRRGKAALVAAAFDDRIAMTIPHQSGTAGVTLSRSFGGESVFSITTIFPHWFAPRFAAFGNQEPRLPIDQHLLVGLVAPRPVLATDGDEDDWADPVGARASVEAAAPVYEFLDRPGLVYDGDVISLEGPLAWHLRPGGHAFETSDWAVFLDFADRHL